MSKTCERHGAFEDVMSVDPAFTRPHRGPVPGARLRVARDQAARPRLARRIKYGRGSVLTVDLTNRCNMMCDPCFMDANQVGFVHELEWDEVQRHPRRRRSTSSRGAR